MNINHFKKKRHLSKFDDEEEYFDKMQQDTTTEARNAKANASSRMPFSDYRQQLVTDFDNPVQGATIAGAMFSPGK